MRHLRRMRPRVTVPFCCFAPPHAGFSACPFPAPASMIGASSGFSKGLFPVSS